MDAKAIIHLDGQELTLLINASIKWSKQEALNGNHYRSQQYLILVDKLADAKEDFHRAHYEAFSERYGLKKEEKPAGEQTFQS